MTQQDRLIGRTLGRYQIEKLLGKGGLAAVYQATDLLWEMPVAVKILPEFFATEQEHRQRFQREASTMANLVHPNIMPVRDYGQAEGVTYFVMDYAAGGTLEDRMGQPMPLHAAYELLAPVAAGVAYAHRQGVVHRDLKPSNILYDQEGHALVADFGIAKLMEEAGLTHTRESLGTPEYMAPEQAREAALVGEPADVYALGVILYQLVTGQVPYEGSSAIDIIEKHKYAAIPSAVAANARLPATYDDLNRRVLAKEPGNRVQSVEELMGLLRLVVEGRPLPPDTRAPLPRATPAGGTYAAPPGAMPGPAPVGAMPVAPPAMPPPAVYAPQPKRSAFPIVAVMLALVAIAAVAAVLYVVLSRPQPDKFYQAGLACYQRDEWDCCIDNFEQALAIEATYRDAAERVDECRQRRVVEAQSQEVKDAWSEIARCEASEDWDCVRAKSKEIATKLDPQDPGAPRKFADASLKQAQALMADDPETALELLREAQDFDVDAWPDGFEQTMAQLEAYLAGVAAYTAGDWQAAIDTLTPYRSFRDGGDLIYRSYVRLCQAALKAGDLDEARAQSGKALELQPQGSDALACGAGIVDASFDAIMQQAQASLDQGQWPQAIDLCTRALAVKPADSTAQGCIDRANDALYQDAVARGQGLLNKCRLNEAIAAFNEALQFKPGDAAAQAGIAQARNLQKTTARRVADSFDDWRSSQGFNGWTYWVYTGGVPQQIPWGGDFAYWWDRREGTRIQQDGQHPGSRVDAVRRWTSTVAGPVTVTVDYFLQSGRGSTVLSLRQDDRTVWSLGVNGTYPQTRQETLSVSPGSRLDLVVNSNGSQTNDLTFVHMTVNQQVSQCTPQ